MRTRIAPTLAQTAAGDVAEAALRSCVHCGMCNATCPTYHLTGDELDGPRGRIYLMKQLVEGERAGELTLTHLDRCLSCRACETTCPSGVEYHRLLDIGRHLAASTTRRPWPDRLLRSLVRMLCLRPWRLAVLLAVARPFRAFLPASLATKIPPRYRSGVTPLPRHARRMTLLRGCVQSASAPHINAANRRVFDAVGISLTETPDVICCGALSFHLDDAEGGRRLARRNIDAWLAEIEAGAEAVVVNASGCAAFIRDYPDVLADDPVYAEKARRVLARMKDPVEVLAEAPPRAARSPRSARIAVHASCTLRNGPGLADAPAKLLAGLGYEPQPVSDPHLCCGSAGAYSLFQPEIAGRLRDEKVAALTVSSPEAIYTANIGCWMHLTPAAPVPVRHWIEAVDEVVSADSDRPA